MNTESIHANERWLKQCLEATESLAANGDHLTVGELISLLYVGVGGSCLHFLLIVKGHVAQSLLDVTNNLTSCNRFKGVEMLTLQEPHQVVGQITASKIHTRDGMGERVALIDGNDVGHTISRVNHSASGATRSIQRQCGLDGNVQGWSVEGLEHDLGHRLSVGFGTMASLSQEHTIVLRRHTQLTVGVVPDLFKSSQLFTIPCSIGYFKFK